MDIRRKFDNQIKKKTQEIETLEKQKEELVMRIREARAYVQGLEDMLKHLPSHDTPEQQAGSIRPGSNVHKAMELLQANGEPMHISDIVSGIGLKSTRNTRAALAGQIAHYARDKRVFMRTAPNTFGLTEWDGGVQTSDRSDDPDVPEGFGQIT